MKLEFTIDCRPPYSLRYHLEGASARRGFWLNQQPVVVDLRQAAENGPVRATVLTSGRTRLPRAELERALRHMLAAEDDLAAVRAALGRDRRLAKLLDALPGLKPLRLPDLWTTLLRSIISQQISTAAARSIREKISRRFGTVIDDVSVVPAPETILKLSEREFAEVGFSARKAEYARGIAEAFTTGRIDARALMQATPEHLVATLSALRGIGVWTAECVGIFCLGHPDLLPADDLGIQQSIGALYRLPAAPRPKQVEQIGQKWAGWRSYASIYLWAARNHNLLPARVTPARRPAAAARSRRPAPSG